MAGNNSGDMFHHVPSPGQLLIYPILTSLHCQINTHFPNRP
jgi:hypothetical protein